MRYERQYQVLAVSHKNDKVGHTVWKYDENQKQKAELQVERCWADKNIKIVELQIILILSRKDRVGENRVYDKND